MKGIEEIIKESVKNYEVPYDASVWDSLSAKLDAGAKASPKRWPWILGIAGAAAIVTTIVLLQNGENDAVKIADKEIIESTIITPNESILVKSDETVSVESEEQKIEEIAIEDNVNHNNLSSDKSQKNDRHNGNEKIDKSTTQTNVNVVDENKDPSNSTNNTSSSIRKFIVGDISKTTICKGDVIRVSNTKKGHVLFAINNEVHHLINGEEKEIKLDGTSEIKFVNDKGETLEAQTIIVNEAAPVEFTYENFYVQGVPVTRLQTFCAAEQASYTLGNKEFNGKDVSINIFDKASHKVTLNTVDANGCKNSITEYIQNENDYNLLAVNAFNPNSAINENRTFMPFALTERTNTLFTLTIFDSRDNQIIFQSSNASEFWDGTDRRTGRIADDNVSYVWQVKLKNPLPGEKNAYAGTITIQSNL